MADNIKSLTKTFFEVSILNFQALSLLIYGYGVHQIWPSTGVDLIRAV